MRGSFFVSRNLVNKILLHPALPGPLLVILLSMEWTIIESWNLRLLIGQVQEKIADGWLGPLGGVSVAGLSERIGQNTWRSAQAMTRI
jgi:hypothetical protein